MQHPDYDPPTYGGTPKQEAHAEMIQIFGLEKLDQQWILTDFDVWEKNPYYNGPPQQHPEMSDEEWNAHETFLAEKANEISHVYAPEPWDDSEIPF